MSFEKHVHKSLQYWPGKEGQIENEGSKDS